MSESYKLSMTPTPLITDSPAVAQHAWTGKWRGDDLAEASSVFGLQFS